MAYRQRVHDAIILSKWRACGAGLRAGFLVIDIMKTMQSSPSLKAVLFDLDGTLIHSVDHIVDCWQHTVRTCLGREITREEVLPTLGRTLFDAFEEIAPGRSQELYGVYK